MKKLIRCLLATTFAVAMLVAAGLDTSWREAHAQDEGLGCASSGIARGPYCGRICYWRISWHSGRAHIEYRCRTLRYCLDGVRDCEPVPE